MQGNPPRISLVARVLAGMLANAVLLTSPGLSATTAFAQVVRQVRVPGRAPSSGPLQLLKLDLPVGRPVPRSPSALAAAPRVLGNIPAPSRRLTAAVELARPDAVPLAEGAGVLESLESYQTEIKKDDAPLAIWSTLKSLYTGSSSEQLPETLEVAGSLSLEPSGLLPQSRELLEETAKDAERGDSDRLEAIAALSRSEDPQAVESLRRIGAANPQGGAREYEIHRAALKALAGKGVLQSLRPVTRAHADEILEGLSGQKPQAAFFDYDDTLEKHLTPASPETAAALKASADAGVETVILTDRPDTWTKGKTVDDSVAQSLSTLSPQQKAALTVISNRGTRLSLSDRRGELFLIQENDLAWTEGESQALLKAASGLPERFGSYEYNGKSQDLTKNIFVYFLTPGTEQARINEATAFLQAELVRLGLDYKVTGKKARSVENPPYLVVTRNDKSVGVLAVRSNRRVLDQMRDALRLGLPKSWASRLWKLLRRLPASPIAARDVVVVGDQFFGEHDSDAGFVRGAPGGLALAVGGTADPRLENIFVWPSQGKTATSEILGALGRQAPSEMNKKAVAGLFLQRTISIAAFILTTIAFPFIAVPVVGWAGYGALMALGPLAAIAAGPLNGLMTDKLSPRNALLLNTAIRIVLSLALPAFAFFGVLNFWTLLAAAIASGWLMSSIMISESAFIKDLAGEKNIGIVNSLAWINYLLVQVGLGLIAGIGKVVDLWNPLWAFHASAIAHAALILPIIWLTIPNLQKPPSSDNQSSPGLSWNRIKEYLRKHWPDALVLGAAVAAYFLLHTPLPMAGALVFLIARTDGFAELWKNKGLRNSMLYLSLIAFLVYPLQYFALPKIAEILAGADGKGMLLGQFLGAFFFGNLISTAAQARLPSWKIPLIGRIPAQRFIQAGVLGLGALWVFLRLFPGSWLAAGAAVLAGAGLIWAASKLTDRAWLRFLGAGLASIWLPYLVWSVPGLLSWIPVPLALFASLLAIGMFFGPVNVFLNSYFQSAAKGKNRGTLIGIEGSFFNAAISIGFALLAMAAGMFTPAFPAALLFLGLAYLAGGLLFLRAPKDMPDLPKDPAKKG